MTTLTALQDKLSRIGVIRSILPNLKTAIDGLKLQPADVTALVYTSDFAVPMQRDPLVTLLTGYQTTLKAELAGLETATGVDPV